MMQRQRLLRTGFINPRGRAGLSREPRQERGGRRSRRSATPTTSDVARRCGSAQPFVTSSWVAAAASVAIVAPPWRSAATTLSSSHLGHGTQAHATRLARIYETGSGLLLGCAGILMALVVPAVHAEPPSLKQEEPFHYNAHGRRDPFVSLVRGGMIIASTTSTATSGATPVLYGIVWDPAGQSVALLNDSEVKVGQEIDGYKVHEIRQDAVVLSNGGEPVVLRIVFDAEPTKRLPGTITGGKHQ